MGLVGYAVTAFAWYVLLLGASSPALHTVSLPRPLDRKSLHWKMLPPPVTFFCILKCDNNRFGHHQKSLNSSLSWRFWSVRHTSVDRDERLPPHLDPPPRRTCPGAETKGTVFSITAAVRA